MKRVRNVKWIFLGCLPLLAACAPAPGYVTPETRYVIVDKPARIPPGVVRYCWEEPMVELEPNGPGVDTDGRWYHASYVAVREVKQGRWRPCRPVASEIKGETKNER
jgi:hypothetical protein